MYDPRVIEEFARRLLKKAQSIVITCTVIGAMVGALAGLAAARDSDSLAMWGALIGAVIGFGIGSDKAFHYRLAAQTVLCQVMIERNTRAAAEALAPGAAASNEPVAA